MPPPSEEPPFLSQDVREVVDLLGLYALGKLDPADEARVRLAVENSELVEILLRQTEEAAAALPLADPAMIGQEPPQPPAGAEERVMATIRRYERRQGWRRLAATAAAAAAIVVVFGAGRLSAPAPAEPPLEAISFTVIEDIEVVEADLINHTWGTELVMTVTDVAPGGVYQVAFLDQDGQPVEAGSFLGAEEPVICRMNAAILREAVTGLVVQGPDGATVLRSELS
ncbi:hypothetical protein [Euzebya tangerina]|uniref:hypothetical protein n=1 Tax=Euzebya tangerina TaxID=591198 RepID=UPI0013C2B92D|nr:hypothetical protein [Euzebya tangerina]